MLAAMQLASLLLFIHPSTWAFTTHQWIGTRSTNTPTTLAVKRSPIVMPTTEPLVPYKAPGSTQAQFIGLKSAQLRSKKLWITQYIDDEASNSIISSLLYIQSEAKSEGKIELFLNIPGAVLRPALAIYDAVNELKNSGMEVATLNVALCAGMGSLICGAGTKGMRKSMPNARFLLQKTGMEGVYQGQASDIALEVGNLKLWNEKMNAEISKVTGQPIEKIDEDLKRDFYLSSDEAVRYGLIDGVLMPSFSKRQPVVDRQLDIGVFQSGQKYQGEEDTNGKQQSSYQPPSRGQKGSGDDGPTIGKA